MQKKMMKILSCLVVVGIFMSMVPAVVAEGASDRSNEIPDDYIPSFCTVSYNNANSILDYKLAESKGLKSASVSYTIYATREGLVGHTTANGHVIQDHDHFVALPSTKALCSKDGHEYEVRLTYNGKTVTAPVWDVGPWNTKDDYWNPSSEREMWKDLPRGKPEAQAAYQDGYNDGKDQFGRMVANPAGIDLADGTFWDDLGMANNDWVDVEFLWATGGVTKDLPVPYIHQCGDTPDDFVGTYACAPTSAVMILAYYGRVPPNPITVSYPSPHNSNYGVYVSTEYTYNGHIFSNVHTEVITGCGIATGKGAWGYVWQGGVGNIKDNLQKYLELHDFTTSFVNKPDEESAKKLTQQEIDNGRPLIARTYLTSDGHYAIIVGYRIDTNGNFWYLVNDPFGDESLGDEPYGPNTCLGNYGVKQPVSYSYSQMHLGADSRGLITIQPILKPPIASFTFSPKNPVIDEEVTFDASASYDPDRGDISYYSWEFYKLTPYVPYPLIHIDEGPDKEVIKYSFFQESEYEIKLTVTDDEGEIGWTYRYVEVKKTRPISLDLIFAIDTTGSMGDDIDNVKASASAIVDEVLSDIPGARIAVVDYRDFPVDPYGAPGDYNFSDVLSFSTDKPTIVAAIQGLTLGNGLDWEESVYSALMHSIDSTSLGSWRGSDQAAKVIILMGDAPPHDPEPFTGYTLSSVSLAAELADPVIIYPIQIGGTVDKFEELAEQTGGEAFTAENAGEVVDAILDAIEEIKTKPIAYANGPYLGYVGCPITFDGTGSYDMDGTIVSYEWDLDDDGEFDDATGATPSKTWDNVYSGGISLKIIDNDGNDDVDSTTVTVRKPVAVETATGTGTAYFASDSGTIEDLIGLDESAQPEENPNVDFPHGLFSFNITGLDSGQTVNITIAFPQDIPTTAQYWKYHTPEGWYLIPMGSNNGDNIITITLQDGGMGDDDEDANGVIVDQGGPGIPVAAPNITSFAPLSPVNDTVCNWRTFNITVNQTVNVSWYVNGSLLSTNQSVTEANYTLHADVVRVLNVTVIAANNNGTDMQTWIWNVTGTCAPIGGFSVSILPKIKPATAAEVCDFTVRLRNTQNFVEYVDLDLTLSGIPVEYVASLTWFNWTTSALSIPAGEYRDIGLRMDIPDGISGYKSFGIIAHGTFGDSKDYGVVNVTLAP
ncbi:hypothetical protein C5S31_04765 [ANME-1 cluster archaeon GoMg2]|nr:hypothetical protein [ANME-1 cluster archaeon GoMg2]